MGWLDENIDSCKFFPQIPFKISRILDHPGSRLPSYLVKVFASLLPIIPQVSKNEVDLLYILKLLGLVQKLSADRYPILSDRYPAPEASFRHSSFK